MKLHDLFVIIDISETVTMGNVQIGKAQQRDMGGNWLSSCILILNCLTILIIKSSSQIIIQKINHKLKAIISMGFSVLCFIANIIRNETIKLLLGRNV